MKHGKLLSVSVVLLFSACGKEGLNGTLTVVSPIPYHTAQGQKQVISAEEDSATLLKNENDIQIIVGAHTVSLKTPPKRLMESLRKYKRVRLSPERTGQPIAIDVAIVKEVSQEGIVEEVSNCEINGALGVSRKHIQKQVSKEILTLDFLSEDYLNHLGKFIAEMSSSEHSVLIEETPCEIEAPFVPPSHPEDPQEPEESDGSRNQDEDNHEHRPAEPPGRELPGRDLPGRNQPGRDLPGRDLPGRDLPGRNLPGR